MRCREMRLGGLGEFLGGLRFAFGDDDAGAAFAFGLGLPRHGAFHRFGQGDVVLVVLHIDDDLDRVQCVRRAR